MADIGVAHLVRAKNGIEPFRRFLDSYSRHDSGFAHDLLIIYKGFASEADAREYREILKPFSFRELFVSDLGFDLRAYSHAARRFEYKYFCFLNSFSVILQDSWLAKLNAAAIQPQVGLVGATGSYESMYTNVLSETDSRNRLLKSLRAGLNSLFFKPFPNPHIRTTGFMIPRSIMLKIWPHQVVTKAQAYFLENGRNGLTPRILRRNLKVLVVGRDGRAYEQGDWASSNTFRQSNQENLLIADNQTRQFDGADQTTRQRLSRISWGPAANPAKR